MRWTWLSLPVAAMSLACGPLARAQEPDRPLRVGIIGLDTSHVVAFTRALNDPKAPPEFRGVRVVAAYPGGSPDLPTSRDRIEGFTKQLRDELKIEIVDTIPTLLERVDAVLLESVDGRPHLKQARPVLEAGKPLFIDKPMAASLADAIAIFDLAEKTGTPCFSSSSLRFSPNIVGLRRSAEVGDVVGCETYGSCSYLEFHPELFFYGIHGVEALYAVMGPGCVSVSRASTEGTDLVTGVWKDGRIGAYRGIRQGKADFGALVFGTKGITSSKGYGGYEPLLVEVCKFFRTRKPPVGRDETTELLAFLVAADASKRQGGAPVPLEPIITKARQDAAALLSSAAGESR